MFNLFTCNKMFKPDAETKSDQRGQNTLNVDGTREQRWKRLESLDTHRWGNFYCKSERFRNGIQEWKGKYWIENDRTVGKSSCGSSVDIIRTRDLEEKNGLRLN